MSIQSARDFLTKVANDEDFRNQLRGCKTQAEQLQIAQRAGFHFSSDEVNAARNELQDADLDVVSGGCTCGNEAGGCTGSCESIET